MTVGRRLAELRRQKKISQADLARALSSKERTISRERIAKWENQADVIPRSVDIIMLADFFGVSCDYILRGVTPERIALVHDLGLSDNAIKLMGAFKNWYANSYGFISDMFDKEHGSADYILENISKAIEIQTDYHNKKAQMEAVDDLDEPIIQISGGIKIEHIDIVRALIRDAGEAFIQNIYAYIELEARKHATQDDP